MPLPLASPLRRELRRRGPARSGFPTNNRPSGSSSFSFPIADFDAANLPDRLQADEIDHEKAIVQIRGLHLHAVRQNKRALKLPRRDAPIEKLARFIVGLSAANGELIVLKRHFDLVSRETGHRERDAQALDARAILADPLDIIGRVAVRASLGEALDEALHLIEPQEQGVRKRRGARHFRKALYSDFDPGPATAPASMQYSSGGREFKLAASPGARKPAPAFRAHVLGRISR